MDLLPRAAHCAAEPAGLPAGIGGVLFDMCNVLYDDTVWRRWLLKLLAHLGLHTNYRCFFRIWDRDYLDAVHRGERKFCDAFEEFLLSVGLSRGQIDELETACRARRRYLENTARPLPGVRTTLGRLHSAGMVLGVICNSEHPAAVLEEHLRRLALGRLFATVVSSIDMQRTMPDAACYLTAVGSMQLPPERVAFVGHDTAQLAGASAVGMPTVAFNFDPDAEADVRIDRLEELAEILASQPPLAAAG